jgi:hypothetical protein
MPDQITQIPAPRVSITEAPQSYISRPWYRFLYNLYAMLGSGSLRSGAFYDVTNQTAAAPNTAYAVTFGNTTVSQGAKLGTDTSRVYVDRAGYYNIQLTLQFESLSAGAKTISVWLENDGADIAHSAVRVSLAGANVAYTIDRTFMVKLHADNYFRVLWSTTDVNVRLAAVAAAAPVPAIPSVSLAVFCNIGE